MAYPRFQRARAFRKIRHSSLITLNATAITDVVAAGALDLIIEAQVNDEIEYGINGYVSATAEHVGFDVYTIVSAAPVNPFGLGLSASLGGNAGVAGWYCEDVAEARLLTGSIMRTLVAGDIDANGRVTCRLRYAKVNTNARTIPADSRGFDVWARNLGPADPE